MTGITPSHLMPKLRFPEFMGQPLHDVRLREVTEESTTRNGSRLPPASVMGVRKEDGIVPMEERLVAADISRYKLLRNNWFAYNPMRLNIGSIARWQGESDVLVSPEYVVFRCLERSTPAALHPGYLDHFRSSRQWEVFVNEAGDGGVRVRIYYRDLSELRLILPDVAEQQKIADCLDSLDDLITAEGRKLEALQQHKQGLVQQFFPQKGEIQPRLRFPEFTDAPEWKERILDDVCEILNNRRVPITSSDRKPGPYPYYGASGIVDYVDDYIFDERLVLVGEDGAKWGAFEPTAFVADGKYWVNNHAHVLRPHATKDTLLANYLTMIDLGEFVTGAAPPKLTLGKLKTIPIPLSPSDDEHEAIAGCLSTVDAQADAQARKLDALKQHKQGLLQQLFPSLEGR